MGRFTRRILQEPTIWFFGVAISASIVWRAVAPEQNTIVLRSDELTSLQRSFEAQWGRTPTTAEREALIADFVEQELLWREGLRLGLDRGDPIVRRRVVQKMNFLLEATAISGPPSEDTLRRYFEAHAQRYQVPERVTFVHVFQPTGDGHAVSSPEPGQPSMEKLVVVRQRLEAGEPAELFSAPFLRGLRWQESTVDEVERTFGPAFLTALRHLPTGRWSSPIQSLFGWHLVRVDKWHAPELPPFEAVRTRVEQDWLDQERSRAREEGLRRLRKRYRILFESPRPEILNESAAEHPARVGRRQTTVKSSPP